MKRAIIIIKNLIVAIALLAIGFSLPHHYFFTSLWFGGFGGTFIAHATTAIFAKEKNLNDNFINLLESFLIAVKHSILNAIRTMRYRSLMAQLETNIGTLKNKQTRLHTNIEKMNDLRNTLADQIKQHGNEEI
jgi:hypothetical protein